MNDKLELLEAFLKGWQRANERIATERIATDFLKGQMDAIDWIKIQIQKLKEDDN
jgi:hypothetical protein